MEPFGATLRKAFARPLEKSPRQPGALDWLVWKLFFSRWDKLIEENPRLAREMHHVGRSWFLASPIAAPAGDGSHDTATHDASHCAEERESDDQETESQSQRPARLSPADVPSFAASASHEPFPAIGPRFDSAPKVAPMAAAKDKASTSRLRPPRQNAQNAQNANSAA